jgi:hypothetical protein
MSTLLREISQIPATVKYFYAVVDTHAWVANAGFRTTSILTVAQFNSSFTRLTDDISANSEMRDMGKFMMLVNTQGQHYALLRLVQTVDGPTTEGVPNNWDGNGQYWICTWTADPTSDFNVTVARTG